jgi:GNAT superfamily N-acetyltransferase
VNLGEPGAAVRPLDLSDETTLEAVVALQRASYAVEAELIGAPSLPPMHETPEQLRASGESFLGVRRDGRLVGAVSWKRHGDTVDIHRLVVDPSAMRGGIATRLLDALEEREDGAVRWTVGTGAANAPARALYERRGFVAAGEERIMPGGVRYVELERTAPPPPRPWRLLVLGCLALAALSLLTPSTPTYDPWAWIIWGREVMQLDLVTTDGPSWKPLPVFFTAPFSLLGDEVAPELWILVARAGGFLAVAMAYRLAARLAGPAAGAIAALTLLVSDEFIRNWARGNSEGLLVALVLWAVERHLDGRRRDAFLLAFAAGLLRPEVWPFLALYGGWLLLKAWRGRDGAVPWRELALVGGCGVATLILWFVPEYLGSGSALRAAERALQPNPDSAAFAASPFLEVFRRSASILTVPVYIGAALAVAAAWRARRTDENAVVLLALAVMATVLMIGVALMTEGGFAGNLRYVALPAAMVCILAGAGWVGLARAVRARWGTGAAAAVVAATVALFAPFAVADVRELETGRQLIAREADLYGANLKAMIAKAGGEDALKACGAVITGPFQTQAVAWYLHLHSTEVTIFPMTPGTTIGPHYLAMTRDPRFPKVTETRRWTVGSSCTER